MLKERDEFLAESQRKADAIVEEARVQTERMVQRTEVVRQANHVAQRILDDANEEARRLRHEAEDYADKKLASFEIVLDRTMKTVQAGREKLQVSPIPAVEIGDQGDTSLAGGRAPGRSTTSPTASSTRTSPEHRRAQPSRRRSRPVERRPFQVQVAALRKQNGGTRHEHREGVIPDLGAVSVVVPEGAPVLLDLTLSSDPGGITVKGTASAPWRGECRRCGGPVEGTVVAEVRERYAPGRGTDRDEEAYPLSGDELDLEPLARDAVLLELRSPRCARRTARACARSAAPTATPSRCDCAPAATPAGRPWTPCATPTPRVT